MLEQLPVGIRFSCSDESDRSGRYDSKQIGHSGMRILQTACMRVVPTRRFEAQLKPNLSALRGHCVIQIATVVFDLRLSVSDVVKEVRPVDVVLAYRQLSTGR